MSSVALVFPGQGSQYVGMGQEIYSTSEAARQVIDKADRIWQGRLKRIMFEGPAEALTDTANAQPVLYVTSYACWAALQEALGEQAAVQPAFVAGHSLGEYTALAVAGAFSFAVGLQVVTKRGEAMKAAGEARPGRMAAVLGLSSDLVQQACREAAAQTGEPVVVANDNAPGQIVISGSLKAVAEAGEYAKRSGAKRVIPLAVSIAAHSPLMQDATSHLATVLCQAEIGSLRLPVIGNRSARPLAGEAGVLEELEAQLVSAVQWTASIRYMLEQGVTTFIEVGPKDVLTGLLKRIAPEATGMACGDQAGVAAAAALLRQGR